jgi:hypothetical protein
MASNQDRHRRGSHVGFVMTVTATLIDHGMCVPYVKQENPRRPYP